MNTSAPRLFERVRVLSVRPVDFPHAAASDDLAAVYVAAFAALGAHVDAAPQPLIGEGVNVVFGAHLLAPHAVLPQNSIIVNLEQLRSGMFAQPHYLDLLKRHPVLDYSPRNVARLKEVTGNPHVYLCKIGNMPSVPRIAPSAQQDVDVLFYGVINERRRRILEQLAVAGLAVKMLPGIYGAERDAWIARSKIVLNVHFYDDRIHEIVRTSHLLANGKVVVSECEDDTEIEDDVRAAIVPVPYTEIVTTCVELARDATRRQTIEQNAREIFSRRDQSEEFRKILPQLSRPLPGRINLGSGKAFAADMLNIDIDPQWQPDILGNLTAAPGLRQIFFSRRFGLARLEPGEFDEITAMDVLEHVPDLVGLMTRCLELLRVGGRMRIGVPYDLSWGAWQDPTHIRAFNERSWLYFTDWHWYLGWMEARFDLAELKMLFSAVGETLRQRGVASEEIFRTPRAVDSMQLVLAKRPLTEPERQQAIKWHQGAVNRQDS